MALRKKLLLLTLFFTFFIGVALPSYSTEINQLNFTLANGIDVVAISDKNAKVAAISVTLDVGQRDAPNNALGLPHLLEHVVFYGSKNYPEPAGISQFIKNSGGWSNGSTRPDSTRYHLQVEAQYLKEASLRLKDMLYSPLIELDAVSASISEVDEEFKSSRASSWRNLLSVMQASVNPNHPSAKFGIGNSDSLLGEVGTLQSQLKQFHQSHYFSRKTTIAIYGSQSTQALKQIITESFGQQQLVKTTQFISDEKLVKVDELGWIIEVPTPAEPATLDIRIQVPATDSAINEQLFNYLDYIVSYRDKGSLLQQLKAKGLAADVGVYSQGNRHFGVFDIFIELTPQDESNKANQVERQVGQVLAEVDAYFEFLRATSHSEYLIADSVQITALRNSARKESLEAGDWMSDISDEMQLSRFGSDATKLTITDKQLTDYLALFKVSKSQVFLSTNTRSLANEKSASVYKDVKDYKESAFYKAKYRKLKQYRKQPVKDVALLAYQLPSKNSFLPEQTANKSVASLNKIKLFNSFDNNTCNSNAYGSITHKNNRMQVFPSAQGNLITTVVDFKLSNINTLKTVPVKPPVKIRALSELVAEQFSQYLERNFYDAILAGYSYRIFPKNDGIRLVLKGHKAKFEQFYKAAMASLLKEKTNSIKGAINSLVLKLQATNQQQYFRLTMQALQNHTVKSVDVKNVISDVEKLSKGELAAFYQVLKQSADVITSVTGNVSLQQAEALYQYQQENFAVPCATKSAVSANPINDNARPNIVNSNNDNLIKYSHIGEAVTLGFYAEQDFNKGAYKDLATLFVMQTLFKQPFHDYFRRQQKIAYHASVDVRRENQHSVLFTIQSSSVSAENLKQQIREFIEKQLSKPTMAAEFEAARTRVVKEKNIFPANTIWKALNYNNLYLQGFDPELYRQKVKAAAHSLTLEDVNTFIETRLNSQLVEVPFTL